MALPFLSLLPVGWYPRGCPGQGVAGRCGQGAEVWGCTVGSSPATGTLVGAHQAPQVWASCWPSSLGSPGWPVWGETLTAP